MKAALLGIFAAQAAAVIDNEAVVADLFGDPAVTCAIPATSQLDHMRENMGAGLGHVPNEKTRARMSAYLESL